MYNYLIAVGYKLKPESLKKLDTSEPGMKSHFTPIMLHFNVYFRLLLLFIAVGVGPD